MNLERRIVIGVLVAGLPASAVALVLLWRSGLSTSLCWGLAALVFLFWVGGALSLKSDVAFPLRTLSNLLAALREGDFSIRGRRARKNDALGEVFREVNALGQSLQQQRFGTIDATALLRKVMEEIDVAVFAFDGENRLRLVNRAGENLLGRPSEQLIGRSASELGLAECLEGEPVRTSPLNFAGGSGRFEIRRSAFREGGMGHRLLVLSDLSRALREEEREAWQRLIRVLGHEINNTLAPVRSIAESLASLMRRRELPADWREDAERGLAVIGERSASLARFVAAYSRLARLPLPTLRPIDIGSIVRRTAELETRVSVAVRGGPEVTVAADGDQIEQLLVNLMCNAADAALETGGGVTVRWSVRGRALEVLVEDEGPGLSSTANLFVPFFTTKPGGSGIGLVLCRQIAESHGGSLTLSNRAGGRGCEARLTLPLRSAVSRLSEAARPRVRERG